MNSIEALAKERGGAIEALSLIGLSSSWIGALAAHPALFKQYLRDQKRISAKVVHPEPNQTELSNKAGDIYPAFDLLDDLDDEALTQAMREFADKFSIPRIQTLDLISGMSGRIKNLEAELDTLEINAAKEIKARQKRLDTLEQYVYTFLNRTLNGYPEKKANPSDPHDKYRIMLPELRGRLFFTPTTGYHQVKGFACDQPWIAVGETSICKIDEQDQLLEHEVYRNFENRHVREPEAFEEINALRDAALQNLRKGKLLSWNNHGRVLGFGNSKALELNVRDYIDISDTSKNESTLTAEMFLRDLLQWSNVEETYFPVDQRVGMSELDNLDRYTLVLFCAKVGERIETKDEHAPAVRSQCVIIRRFIVEELLDRI